VPHPEFHLIAYKVCSDLDQALPTLVLQIPLFALVPLAHVLALVAGSRLSFEITILIAIGVESLAVRVHPFESWFQFAVSADISTVFTIPNSFLSALDETTIALITLTLADSSVMEVCPRCSFVEHALWPLALAHWVLEEWFISTELFIAIVEIPLPLVQRWLAILSTDQSTGAHGGSVGFDLLHCWSFDVIQQILVFLLLRSSCIQAESAVLQWATQRVIPLFAQAPEQVLAVS